MLDGSVMQSPAGGARAKCMLLLDRLKVDKSLLKIGQTKVFMKDAEVRNCYTLTKLTSYTVPSHNGYA